MAEQGEFGHVPVLLERCVELLAPALTRQSPDGRGATLVDRRLFTPDGVRPQDRGVTTEWVHTADAPAVLDLIVEACRRWC